jgi:hypothetical protein
MKALAVAFARSMSFVPARLSLMTILAFLTFGPTCHRRVTAAYDDVLRRRLQMTKLRLALFAVPVLVTSVFAAEISGLWEMSLKADWTSIPELVCNFSQKGQELRGSCRAARDPGGKPVELTAGKVDGDSVSCQWNIVTPDGETWTYALSGTVDPNGTAMKGSFKLSSRSGGGGEGSFTAKKR